MSKVLVFGSMNLDYTYQVEHFVNKGETITANKVTMQAGGKGLNQAIALSKAGLEVYMAGAVGYDGLSLEETLEKNYVNTNLVDEIGSVNTGHAIIQNDPSGDNCIIVFPGANREINELMIEKAFKFFEEGDYLVLQNEINMLAEIMEKAKEKKMQIIFNPSPMDAKVYDLPLELVDYFVVNEGEARRLLNFKNMSDHLADKELIGQLHSAFPKAKILLTLGMAGSLFMDENVVITQKAYEVDVIDSTAAGDTFLGFFFASVINDMTISESLEIAAKASAIAVTELGAADSIPFLEDLEHYKFV